MKRACATVLALGVAMLAACGDQGPVSGPGTLTATLAGPNGAEGAALLVLLGDPMGAITGIGLTEVRYRADSSGTRVMLINPSGGELSFRVAVPDTTAPPSFVIEQVAGPDDELRSPLSGYGLEFTR